MKNSMDETAASPPFSDNGGGLPQDVFPMFAQLRSKGAVVKVPFPIGGRSLEAWMVVRMEEVVQVLKDTAHFTVDPTSIDGTQSFREFLSGDAEESAPATFFTGKSMLFVDEPDHRRLRSLVSKGFTPRYMESLRPRVQEIADKRMPNLRLGVSQDNLSWSSGLTSQGLNTLPVVF